MSGWTFADIVFDENGHCVLKGGKTSHLPFKEFRLLRLLAASGGAILGRAELMDALWPDENVSEAALTKTVQKLRHRLDTTGDEIVRTVYKVGYQLVPPARRLGLTAPFPPRRPISPALRPEDLRTLGAAVLRLASQCELLSLPALRSAIEIAAVCERAGLFAEMKPVFAAVSARLRTTHGQQFALTQLAEFYLADCLTQLGEHEALSMNQLQLLRPEALAHAEPGPEWPERLARLWARLPVEEPAPAPRISQRR